MKKSIFYFSLLLTTITINAKAKEFKPFVGMDLSYTSVNYNNSHGLKDILDDKFIVPTISVGLKNNKFGFELFYRTSTTETEEILVFFPDGTIANGKTDVKFSGYGVSSSFYIPMTENTTFSPSLGLGFYKGKVDITVYGDSKISASDDQTLGITLGAMFTTKINYLVDVRYGLKYTYFDDKDFSAKNMTDLSFGVMYNF